MGTYCKCMLKRKNDNKMVVALIPKNFAIKGKIVSLEKNGQITGGWKIVMVGSKKLVF